MYFKRAAGVAALLLALPLAAAAQVGLNVDVESTVRAYFAETPVMIEIARCESKFRQFADSGNPLYGGYGGKMVGVFQVYSDIHASFARSMGTDIETLDGNLQYAKYLYEREGTKPWVSSFPCWGSELNGDLSSAGSDSLSINLSLGMEHPQVPLLQKTLNAKGYVIATEGPGSLGSETSKFGSLTRAAVRKFQCAVMQICDGDEYSTGYGFVGSKTRAALAGAVATPAPAPTQPTSGEPAGYSVSEQREIKALQAQILELTKVLNELVASR